ncbi:homing endonuclease associated repeat-containing protein [Halosimplex halophilum]|uniref:homing endonuclease associated repeat-containing protein n=1 Tax=Halosimplex halophilum TaxID=2559572 RepID=UPI00107F0374|nr:hypothetical protein [Halosimplex halophilum]
MAEVATHVDERDDGNHDWEVLGFQDIDEYRHEIHFEKGCDFQETAREARAKGEFQEANQRLEEALWHYQRAQLYTDTTSSIADRRSEVLDTIAEVEAAEQVQVIDDLVDRADNAIDSGDDKHLDAASSLAAREYDEAADALEDALELAKSRDVLSARVQGIERRLRRVQVRQQSLELSEAHRSIRDLIVDARDHAAAGDKAFHDGEYEVALDEYQEAKDRYESLGAVLEGFTFDEPTSDPTECDICRQRFDEEIRSWRIEGEVDLLVCPSCARFDSEGNLPKPREVATEHRSLLENIENIQDKNFGLDWISSESTNSSTSDEVVAEKTNRDTREMLMQLVAVYQRLGEPPSAKELDEYTDFGYLAYQNEFESLEEALVAAGFDHVELD